MPKFLEVTNKAAARAALEVPSTTTALQYVTGLDATGVADCRAELQAIIDNASAGDTIYLPGGKFLISGEVVIDKQLVIRGCGGLFTAQNQGGTFPGVAGTTIVTTSATANALSITASGVVIEDLAVVNTRSNANKPTAGTGIHMNYANNFALSRVTVAGFYDCVRLEGRFGVMDSCHVFDPIRYGIYMYNDNPSEADFGDQGISNCVIAMYGRQSHNAEAAVRWESGGGIRWTGNKIVAGTGPGASNIGFFKYGVDIMVMDNMFSVEFMIAGGAISTCTEACIRMSQLSNVGTSSFTDMTVSGIVLQGTDGKGIIVGAQSPTFTNNIRNVVITGNTFKGVYQGGIVAYNMRGLVVGPNVWASAADSLAGGYIGPLIELAGSPDNGIGTQQVDIYRQTVNQTTLTQSYTVVKDNRGVSTVASLDGFVEYRYKRTFFANTTGWKTMFTIEPPTAGGAGYVDVVFSGQDFVTGGGGVWFSRRIRRSYSKPSGASAAITVATVGTDESVQTTAPGSAPLSGTYPGLQVVDGGSGKLLVQAAMLTGGTTVWGDIEVNVQGRVQKFSIGAGI